MASEYDAMEMLRAIRQTLAEYEHDETLQIEARAIDRFLALEKAKRSDSDHYSGTRDSYLETGDLQP